jgi:bacterioferritin
MDIGRALFESINSEDNSLIDILVQAVSSEMLAASKYWYCYQASRGKGKEDSDPEFKIHYEEEFGHANMLAERINELGGTVPNSPAVWLEKWEFTPVSGTNVKDMLESNIEDEKGAVEFYSKIMELTEGSDEKTYKIAEEIKAKEQEHVEDLTLLLEKYNEN